MYRDDYDSRGYRGGGGGVGRNSAVIVPSGYNLKSSPQSSEPPGGGGGAGCGPDNPAFKKYCEQTSLHGWAYLTSEPGLLRKLYWMVVVMAATGGALAFTYLNIAEFLSATTATSINTTTASLSEILFPSVVLCNVNQVSLAFLNSIHATADVDAQLLFEEFIDGNVNLWKEYERTGQVPPKFAANLQKLQPELDALKQIYGWNDTVSFGKLASQNCSDLILYAKYMSFTPQVYYDAYMSTTDYGTCCLIVPFLDFENPKTVNVPPSQYTGLDYRTVPRGAKNGIQNGLKLMLDVEGYDYAYSTRGAKGLRIVLGDQRDKQVVNQDGFYVSPGTEKLVAVVPQILNTTTIALQRFAPDKRDCYNDQEFEFLNMRWSSGFRYAMKNCLYEAVLEKIASNCSCAPTFVNFKLSSCEFQSNNVISTASTYPNRELLPYRTDFCLILIKLYRSCQNVHKQKLLETFYTKYGRFCTEIKTLVDVTQLCNASDPNQQPAEKNYNPMIDQLIKDYAAGNIAVIKAYIKDPYYTNIKRDQAMSMVSFVGNAGGLAGLCMGFSFVSLFEIFYHIFNACATHACGCGGGNSESDDGDMPTGRLRSSDRIRQRQKEQFGQSRLHFVHT